MRFTDQAEVVGRASLPLGEKDEPQPDIAVLAPRRCAPPNAPPMPAEIYAVIELSDTSLLKGIGLKFRLYARYAIADYLAVDLDADALLHYHEPHELGYRICDRHSYTAQWLA